MLRQFLSAVLVLALSGCSGLLSELAGDPPALYELQAPASVDTTSPVVTKQLLIDVPMASAGVDTPRIALIDASGTMAYYKNVSWTDRAPVMFQTMLVEAFGNSGKLPAVGRENVGLRADYLLKTDLSAFSASYEKGPVPVITVSLNAKLITMPRRMIAAGQVFTARVQAEGDTVLAVRDAFQSASNQALSQLVNWTLAQLQEPARRRR